MTPDSLAFPNRPTEEWQAADLAHHWHPFTDHKALKEEGGARIITRADGVWLTDSDGRKMLDGMAGLWCVQVGYGRKELVDAAARQMADLSYYNAFFKTAHPAVITLAEKLATLTPEGINRTLFSNSGSEAVDTAIRVARHYWGLAGKPSKKTIIGRVYGYHGSTMAGISAGGMHAMHRQVDLPLPGFTHIGAPHFFDQGSGSSEEEFAQAAADRLEHRIREVGADAVAAFIAEPIQGAGGVIMPPEGYWRRVQEICRRHDVLLIADEVICGFGRTGNWFGSRTYDIAPDMMTVAKGLTSGYVPMAATLLSDRVADLLEEKGEEFYHGFTYAGHPVAASVALANLSVIESENLVERAGTTIGPYLERRMRETLTDHPLIGEIRQSGMIGALEIVADKKTRERFPEEGKTGTLCRDHCFANDLVMRAVRDTMVYSPPLTLTEAEADDMVARAEAALDATAHDLGRT